MSRNKRSTKRSRNYRRIHPSLTRRTVSRKSRRVSKRMRGGMEAAMDAPLIEDAERGGARDTRYGNRIPGKRRPPSPAVSDDEGVMSPRTATRTAREIKFGAVAKQAPSVASVVNDYAMTNGLHSSLSSACRMISLHSGSDNHVNIINSSEAKPDIYKRPHITYNGKHIYYDEDCSYKKSEKGWKERWEGDREFKQLYNALCEILTILRDIPGLTYGD